MPLKEKEGVGKISPLREDKNLSLQFFLYCLVFCHSAESFWLAIEVHLSSADSYFSVLLPVSLPKARISSGVVATASS
jgi:hypothetical protein